MRTGFRVSVKTAVKSIGLLLAGCMLGTALLALAFMLPVQAMQRHVEGSIGLMDTGNAYVWLTGGRVNMRLDTYTDSLMLGGAVVQADDSLLGRALQAYHITGGSYTSPDSQLLEYLQAADRSCFAAEPYGRYWHGYLVTLKPALLVMDYGHIRTLNMLLQALLLFFVCYLFIRRAGTPYALGFFAAALCLTPTILPQSLQYSTVFYILLCTLLLILLNHERLSEGDRYPLLFLGIGMVTNYMDLLTYPLVTLGVPLVTLLLDSRLPAKTCLRGCALLSCMWCAGYFGFWVMKWGIGTMLTGGDFFADALSSAAERASVFGSGFSERLQAVLVNAKVFLYKPYALLLAALGITALVAWARGRLRLRKSPMRNIAAFLFVALLPVVWLLVFANHSAEHYWFTHRIWMVTVFALLCPLLSCLSTGKRGADEPHAQ